MKIKTCQLIVLMIVLINCTSGADTPADSKIAEKISQGARKVVIEEIQYKETYQKLDYPDGDVPKNIGVCTDLVVRAFRNAGIDLQQLLHEDRKKHPDKYPTHIWSYKKPDKNIDHRRCQNLAVFFKRHAEAISTKLDETHADQWKAGDVVFLVRRKAEHPWHVGIVTGKKDKQGRATMYHLYPPTASEAPIEIFAPNHSHFRWKVKSNKKGK